ncbi:hypothetical protein L8106_28351 [Lyngbya sp. PCC 8106]|nr:hypothetical protein L8106_28351 [Lyngbya sp. PCC 8106]
MLVSRHQLSLLAQNSDLLWFLSTFDFPLLTNGYRGCLSVDGELIIYNRIGSAVINDNFKRKIFREIEKLPLNPEF